MLISLLDTRKEPLSLFMGTETRTERFSPYLRSAVFRKSSKKIKSSLHPAINTDQCITARSEFSSLTEKKNVLLFACPSCTKAASHHASDPYERSLFPRSRGSDSGKIRWGGGGKVARTPRERRARIRRACTRVFPRANKAAGSGRV